MAGPDTGPATRVLGGTDEIEFAEVERGAWPVEIEGESDTVLVFTGRGGAVAVDLDTGDAVDIRLPGQRPGDPPFPLWRAGGWLVYGWGEIYTALLAPGAVEPIRHLGDATIFLPGDQPGQLWLIDHATGRTGSPYTARLVALGGSTLGSTTGRLADEPVRGVPGGLALRRDDGTLAKYDVEADRVVDYLGEAAAHIADVVSSQMAWCEEPCEILILSDAVGQTIANITDPNVEQFDPTAVWLSPDGSNIAAAVMVTVGAGVSPELRIYQTGTGSVVARKTLPLGVVNGGWSVDGLQFFYSLGLPGTSAAPQLLGRWQAGEAIRQFDVAPHLSGLGVFAALPRHLVAPFVDCRISDLSHQMGQLPAWAGEHVHVALSQAATGGPSQIFVGIPHAGSDMVFTISARRVDGAGEAAFFFRSREDSRTQLTVTEGMRMASGWPPHWALGADFSRPGCWQVTVETDEFTDSITIPIVWQ